MLLLASVPLAVNPYYVIVISYALVFSIACLGLNLLLGHAGLLSLGHTAYFGLGAYTGAFLFTFGDVTSFEVYLASGVACAVLVASVVGFLCVRTTRIFFTILTLAFAQMLQALLVGGAAFRPFGEVGKGFFLIGHGGLYLPRFTLAGMELEPERFSTVIYYVILVAFASCVVLMWRILHSPFGKALRATRDNEVRARFIGIPVTQHRWLALRFPLSHHFVLGVLLIGIMSLCPGGLAEIGVRVWARLRGRAAADALADFIGGAERPWIRP